MKQFTKPEFNLIKDEPDYAQFKVEPLERGFGTTLGNALRRTLLAATPGAAVFAIKIAGASHEFASISGIVENVSRIVLNIKQLILKIDQKSYNDEEEVKLMIRSTTPGVVLAGDLETPVGVQVLNKDLHIATIAEGGVLDLTLYAKNSRGYKTFSQNKEDIKEVGLIPIDSNYSPVVKVAYTSEPTKLGKSMDVERLIFELTTDQSIRPIDAVSIAAKVLNSHLDYFTKLNDQIDSMEIIGVVDEEEKELDRPIEDLEFTQRSLNCLKRAGIDTLRELVSRSEDDIQEIRNLGRKSFKEIKDKVAELGLTFKQM